MIIPLPMSISSVTILVKQYKTMKYFTVLLSLCLLVGVASADLARDAGVALKKMNINIETGISHNDYGPALADMKLAVSLFLESDELARYPAGTKEQIEVIVRNYDIANDIWGRIFRRDQGETIYITNPLFATLLELYPKIPVVEASDKSYAGGKFVHVKDVAVTIWAENVYRSRGITQLLIQGPPPEKPKTKGGKRK